MISRAKKNFDQVNFNLYNGKTIKKPKASLDMCFSFGTLHHTSNFYDLIDQMVKISKKYGWKSKTNLKEAIIKTYISYLKSFSKK